jgi:hypothetical protein
VAEGIIGGLPTTEELEVAPVLGWVGMPAVELVPA